MKYYIKYDFVNIFILIIPAIVSVISLSIFCSKLFSFKRALEFVCITYIPLLIILFIMINLTFVKLTNEGIEIHYGGIIKKNIMYESVSAIETTKYGFGLFALNKDKVVIITDKAKYLVSIKHQEEFLKRSSKKLER